MASDSDKGWAIEQGGFYQTNPSSSGEPSPRAHPRGPHSPQLER
ncbi:hypothetical protein NMG60_11004146 [Bertholletia excelsa]